MDSNRSNGLSEMTDPELQQFTILEKICIGLNGAVRPCWEWEMLFYSQFYISIYIWVEFSDSII